MSNFCGDCGTPLEGGRCPACRTVSPDPADTQTAATRQKVQAVPPAPPTMVPPYSDASEGAPTLASSRPVSAPTTAPKRSAHPARTGSGSGLSTRAKWGLVAMAMVLVVCAGLGIAALFTDWSRVPLVGGSGDEAVGMRVAPRR